MAKAVFLAESKTKALESLRKIQQLRDDLAHANFYANSTRSSPACLRCRPGYPGYQNRASGAIERVNIGSRQHLSIHSETEADTRANRIDPRATESGMGGPECGPWGQGQPLKKCSGLAASCQAANASLQSQRTTFFRVNGHVLGVVEAKKAGKGHTSGVGQAKELCGAHQCTVCLFYQWAWLVRNRHADGPGTGISSPSRPRMSSGPAASPLRTPGAIGLLQCRFETGGGKWEPRYYQARAVNAALEAIAEKKDRLLLTLATWHGQNFHRLPNRVEALRIQMEPILRADS